MSFYLKGILVVTVSVGGFAYEREVVSPDIKTGQSADSQLAVRAYYGDNSGKVLYDTILRK